MKRNYVDSLAKLMKIDAQGLRNAKIPQEQVRKVYVKARRAKWILRCATGLMFTTFVGFGMMPEKETPEILKLEEVMAGTLVGSMGICAFKKRAAEMTEVAVVLSRRLAELEKERG